ncbi:helix-turn-helix transcriptional regulator [Pedobacter gandavensis]|uniref:helix-turn-helix domain-containing protein n=1 Tax=Pedobacter gandavensis TaxID=2679963 RepID=UPI0029307B80|nr:helix-turn-helix transcriptional regulator [Pedobacter gandavensis]
MLNKEEQTVFYERVGDLIKSARKSRDIKQEVLASEVGISRISLVNIETGNQKVPLHVLLGISDYLKIPLKELLPHEHVISHDVDVTIINKIKKEIEDTSESQEKVLKFLISLKHKKS